MDKKRKIEIANSPEVRAELEKHCTGAKLITVGYEVNGSRYYGLPIYYQSSDGKLWTVIYYGGEITVERAIFNKLHSNICRRALPYPIHPDHANLARNLLWTYRAPLDIIAVLSRTDRFWSAVEQIATDRNVGLVEAFEVARTTVTV